MPKKKMKNIKKEKLGRRGFLKMAGATGLGLGLGTNSIAAEKNMDNNAVGCLAQDYKIVFHNPDREIYIEGCGLTRMYDGTFVAVVPVVTRGRYRSKRSTYHTHIVQSTNGGNDWQPVAQLPYYSAVPWLYGGKLYLFAMKGDYRHSGGSKYRNDDLLLLQSEDGGKSWSDPVTLFKGHYWNCHTGMVFRENRLYWAVDDLAAGPRGPRVVSCDLTKDPMDKSAWRISNAVPRPDIPEALINPKFSEYGSKYLEPNVIDVGGKIRVISCVKPVGQSTAGLAAVLDLKDDGERLDLKFTQFHPRPGGQLKFCIIWDEVSKMFWSTANLVVDSQNIFGWRAGGNDRRFLMLFYGLDGLNWFQAGCVAQAKDVERSFMYATPVIDGNDLAIISRSNIDGPNRHDADCATFHRVKNFRELANVKLVPEGETL